MSGYFDQLEQELRTALPRVVRATPASRPRWRPAVGAVAISAAVLVTLAVAAVAVVLLGHARTAPQAPAGRRPVPRVTAVSPAPASVVPTLAQLLANFAVLRRPQTAADRAWGQRAQAVNVRRLTRLTRLAKQLDSGDRVFLTVDRFRKGPAGQRAGSYSLSVWIVSPDGNASGTSFGPQVNYNVIPLPARAGGARPEAYGFNSWAGLVPDGVSRVSWRFTCRANPLTQCSGQSPFTATVPVVDNVASWTGPVPTGECGACLQPISVVWYGSHGQVLLRYGAGVTRGNLQRPPFIVHGAPVPAPTSPTGPARITTPLPLRGLAGDGVDGARFGQSAAVVLRQVAASIGSPSAAYRPGGTCEIDQVIAWGPAHRGSHPLTMFFHAGRFAGYAYFGTNGKGFVDLATTRGLAIGDTLARASTLYPRALTTSSAQGGVWKVRTAAGTLRGYADGGFERGQRVPTPASRVGSIDAGDVGCPAVSP
jgi:hypothetical protein